MTLDRITAGAKTMGDQPCIRGMRLTVKRVLEAISYPFDRSGGPVYDRGVKVVSRRSGPEDPIADARILLRTIRRLRGDALVPRGVYRFTTVEEADTWMTRQMARIHARQNSKTSSRSAGH